MAAQVQLRPGLSAPPPKRPSSSTTTPTHAAPWTVPTPRKPRIPSDGSASGSRNVGAVTPPQVNLEEQLQEMFSDPGQQPILLCLGQKGGGKSFRTMTLLMWLLRNNVFDQYFLVLPTFYYEAANSYAWLKPFEDKVFVCREYTPELSRAFLERPDETIPPHAIPRTFLWLDDVGMNEAFRTDRHFVGLLSVARHKRLSVCLCYHSLTSGHTLSPFLRQNVTHTLLFRVTNEKLLESIFEELISMTGHFPRFREFKEVYNRHTCSQVNPTTGEIQKNFNGICINNSIGCLDWKVADWFHEETEVLVRFLDNMKREMAEHNLPAPAKNQNLKEIVPPMIANVKGAAPSVGIAGSGSGKGPGFRTELTPESWNQLKQAANDPVVFLTHPRNLVKYHKVPMSNSNSSLQRLLQPRK
jgi:hypothetical protein